MTAGNSPYSALVESELEAELQRKAATDSRAASLVTTSVSLVTILAAVAAFVGADQDAPLPWHVFPPLVLAMTAFVFASFAGIMAWRPMKYKVAGIKSLNRMVGDHWSDDDDFASLAVANVRVRMIAKLREVNERKGWWLYAGWWSQIAALVLLLVVVVAVLNGDNGGSNQVSPIRSERPC